MNCTVTLPMSQGEKTSLSLSENYCEFSPGGAETVLRYLKGLVNAE